MTNQSPTTRAPLLSMRGIKKAFSGVRALIDGNLELNRGEVHALCGGNGAGKSTLLNILMGFIKPDQGEISIEGKAVHFHSAKEALDSGIAIVQQELSGIPHLTVAENIFLGAEPSRHGFVDFRQLNEQAGRLLNSLGFDLDPTAKMDSLSIASQQLVEIAKALSHRKADILIFDEPTSALGEQDTGRLFKAMSDLAAAGKGVIFVTHRMAEISAIADTYTVLKDGVRVEYGKICDITPEHLVECMIGGDVEKEFIKESKPTGAPLLEVKGLTRGSHFADISFTLHAGEVLGLYGLSGSGRTEILETIFGLHRGHSGTISMDGRRFEGGSVREALDAGIACVTEDRKQSGLVPNTSVGENLTLSILKRIHRLGFVRGKEERARIDQALKMMRIKTQSDREPVRNLSGGNQQKVVFGRCVLCEPKILLLDEPTRGVDIGTKKEIYRFISDFAGTGGGVIMVSSDLEEVLRISDRILVLRKGHIACEFSCDQATQKKLMMAAV